MQLIDYIGLIGSCTIGLSFIPQTYKIIKNKDISSISLTFIIINILSSFLMIIYGLYFIIIPMIIANSSVFINNLIILFYYILLKSST